jgi:hypothetical protein
MLPVKLEPYPFCGEVVSIDNGGAKFESLLPQNQKALDGR